ncbi:tetratricopeptide repeat-containing protein [Neoroseomonas lacus]|uniref:Adenylate cyclase n=1 Tax=Neoroseomonas lacus TaxID=287609 RepID=A0A917KYM4_9PROT|nr:tetratricopeptide repeat-containing protein [Neoroseomonas lacus]GGJ31305.1 adenylate cyclase [Neoroseomonas lacus]
MSDSLAEVLALEAEGLLLSAHDRAMAAMADHPDDPALRYRATLTIARAGATGRALDLFHQLRLDAEPDPEIAALGARLIKDRAFERPVAARGPLLAEAARRYEDLWRRGGAGWHGVNAAAMHLLGGDRPRAVAIAEDVLRGHRDAGDYWSAATEAEAQLLAGRELAARTALEEAEARAGSDLSARATTRRQLRREAIALGVSPAIVDALRIPAVLHYTGHMPKPGQDDPAIEGLISATLDATIAAQRVGMAFGGLAAGLDILAVEALLRAGVTPTVVLPCDADTYEAASVLPAGERWVARYRALLPRVRLMHLDERPFAGDDLHLAMAARRAMGLARLHARHRDGTAVQVAAWDQVPSRGSAGTGADVAAWTNAGGQSLFLGWPWPRNGPVEALPEPRRRPMAVLFGDLPRFSALDDEGLARFYEGPLVAMGAALERHPFTYCNCWGDAVQITFEEITGAAACAFDMRAALETQEPPIHPRFALDFGPMLPVYDSVQRAHKYSGRAMTRAARIEPVTPPGRIFATEAFACEVALLPRGAGLACDYAGHIPTAKSFGSMPLYALRRSGFEEDMA